MNLDQSVEAQEFFIRTVEVDEGIVNAFLEFAHNVSKEDGTSAFSEQTLVEVRKTLRHPEDADQLILVVATASENEKIESADQILGVATALLEEDSTAVTIEGAVAPIHRAQGIGAEISQRLHEELAHTASSATNLWVHQIQGEDAVGERKAAETLARRFDFSPVRELRKMQLWLTDDVRKEIQQATAEATAPSGINIDTFSPVQDDAAWISANAAAFADHPEQGSLDLEDLKERKESDWFEAEGFFLARTETNIAGFHWTKIPREQSEPREGEIYAVGITPEWQGKKLGKTITLVGMDYLSRYTDEAGNTLEKIVLYVDADNDAAVSLYKSLGFVEETVDIMYSKQS